MQEKSEKKIKQLEMEYSESTKDAEQLKIIKLHTNKLVAIMVRLGNKTQKYNPAKYLSRAAELELNCTDK